MGTDEIRAIKTNLLLEFEESKDELALLRAKANQLERLHLRLATFALRMQRDDAGDHDEAAELAGKLDTDRELIDDLLTVGVLLRLNDEIEAAVKRFGNAVRRKKELGFS